MRMVFWDLIPEMVVYMDPLGFQTLSTAYAPEAEASHAQSLACMRFTTVLMSSF